MKETLSDFVKCLICGYELSGTTALSELIRHHPQLDGRFEVGRLLFESSEAFRESIYGEYLPIYWELEQEAFDYICGAGTARDFYLRLRERSKLDPAARFMYDKTPLYMKELTKVLARCDLPCVVNVRDPRALYFSMARRDTGLTLDRFFEHYRSYAEAFLKAYSEMPERLCLVRHEALCLNPSEEGRRVYAFLGLDFDERFARFERKHPLHTNIEGELGPVRMLLYQEGLPRETQETVLRELRDFSGWFYRDAVAERWGA